MTEVHSSLKMPVQLIWGADDKTFPIVRARQMFRELPQSAELVEVRSACLLVHEEKPREVAEAALRFLHRAHSARRSAA